MNDNCAATVCPKRNSELRWLETIADLNPGINVKSSGIEPKIIQKSDIADKFQNIFKSSQRKKEAYISLWEYWLSGPSAKSQFLSPEWSQS